MLLHLCSYVLSSKYHEMVLECGISLTIPVFHNMNNLLYVPPFFVYVLLRHVLK